MLLTMDIIDTLVGEIKSQFTKPIHIGLILGSGLGKIADEIRHATIIPYSKLADWPTTTVIGHAGRVMIGELENKQIFVMQGRAHFYEGYSMSQITLPIRVMQRLGIEILLITNVAGAVNPKYIPGDVMLITDNLNLVGLANTNPLIGPNLDEFGPRFPSMIQAYDRQLSDLAHKVAKDKGIRLQEGVYAYVSGPSFESPADLRFLRMAGVDAVGMSTVPEVIVANHGGMRVLGFSGISNRANLNGNTVTTHEEVLKAGKLLIPKLDVIIRGILRVL